MSLPTTPARSIAPSTRSTPSTAQHGDSPQDLTPRSKVKAMLAAIDDESDSNTVAAPLRSGRSALATVTGNIQKIREARSAKEDATPSQRDLEDVEDGWESEEPPIVPRGRLAARLNGLNSIQREQSSTSEGEGDGDAYDRIKKRLLQKHDTKIHKPMEKTGGSVTTPDTRPSKRQRTSSILSDRTDSKPSCPTRSRTTSPGLFLTPEAASKQRKSLQHSVDSDESGGPLTKSRANSRFMELVAKNRAEREAKQEAEKQKKAERAAGRRSFEKALLRDASPGSGVSDDDMTADRRLTQHSRPTRKASKKAIEEMNRETQRMSRNMQLAHQAKTKKKISKQSLLDRFNFRTSVAPNIEVPQILGSSTGVSSAPGSDLEDGQNGDTPPTSPIIPKGPLLAPVDSKYDKQPAVVLDQMQPSGSDDEQLPSMLEVMSQPTQKLDKGKGKAIDYDETEKSPAIDKGQKRIFKQPPIKVRLPKSMPDRGDIDLDSNNDLEVLPVRKSKPSKVDVFDRLPTARRQEGRSMQTLRALAHLDSPEKLSRAKKTSVTQAEMQRSLQQRARRQAMEERKAKIDDLKRRGIIIQTAEERERDQAVVEDLVDKARREADEIMEKEKRAAKKDNATNGEEVGLADSSEEDDDYQADADNSDVEGSGSDEDEEANNSTSGEELNSDGEQLENEDDGEVVLGKDDGTAGLIDDKASEDSQDEDGDEPTIEESDQEEERESRERQVHRRRTKMVIEDDDDDYDDKKRDEPPASALVESSAPEVPVFAALAQPHLIASPMGLTQAFAATMAATQSQGLDNEDEQDSLAFLGPPPEPNFPMFEETDSPQVVEDSQNGLPANAKAEQNTNTSNEIDLHLTQSQIRFNETPDSQVSEVPDPTQDVGFAMSSPAPARFVSDPPSTVDTVLLSGTVADGSPIRKRRGRLQRGVVTEEDPLEEDEDLPAVGRAVITDDATKNVFDVMKKAKEQKKSETDNFDKKRSEAKTMVEEQAQESEDEYAGIGGASDDESGGEDDEFVREMIDQGEVDVKERELASHYANNERARDENDIAKLYKDINSGMLRRKRGAEFDLSDSDDDAEARRRRKRREFAKMRKALLENENVGKIAEDPKKLAFLRAIEDREDDDDLDFLDRPAEDSFRIEPDTQEEPESQTQPTLPDPTLGKQKRPLQDSVPDKGNMRPPAAARRTQAPKKPATLAEIRESVSFLIEEPGSMTTAPDPSSSASEDESSTHHDENHRNPRRRPNPNPIIDRLSLKRAESANAASTSRLAFHDPSTSSSTTGGFKVPSLLRRATTTNLSTAADNNNGITTLAATTERAAGGGEKGDFVRRGGTKKSSVNYFARELEKNKAVEGMERRRKEERERVAKGRVMRLGGLSVGAFE